MSEDNIEPEEVRMDGEVGVENGGTGPELLGKTDKEEHVLPETVVAESEHIQESNGTQDGPEQIETTELNGESHDANHAIVLEDKAEEEGLLHPIPEFPISSPFLKFALEITPPSTPRDSSPMQQAIEKIHSTTVDEEPSSPVDRKEEDVLPPTSVCNFTPVDEPSREDEDAQVTKEDDIPSTTDDPETHSKPDEPETKEHDDSAPAMDTPPEHPANDETPTDVTEQADSTEPEETAAVDAPENNEDDDEEFVVISPEQAPLELAEEYPQVQFEDNYPIGGDEESEEEVPPTSIDSTHEVYTKPTEENINAEVTEIESPTDVVETAKDVDNEKDDLAEIEGQEISPAEVIAEDEEPTVISASQEPLESVEIPAAIEEPQLEAEEVVNHPTEESPLTEPENVDHTAEAANTVEEKTISPTSEEVATLEEHEEAVPTEHVVEIAEDAPTVPDNVTVADEQQEEVIPQKDLEEAPEEGDANDAVVEAPVTETPFFDQSSEVEMSSKKEVETLPDVAIEETPVVEQPLEEEATEKAANENTEQATVIEDAVVEHPLVVGEGKSPFLGTLMFVGTTETSEAELVAAKDIVDVPHDTRVEESSSEEQPLEEETTENANNDKAEPATSVEDPLVVEDGKSPFLAMLIFAGTEEPFVIESVPAKEVVDAPHDTGIEEPPQEEPPAEEDHQAVVENTPVEASLTEPTAEEGTPHFELSDLLTAVVEAPVEVEPTPEQDVLEVPQDPIVQEESSDKEPLEEDVHSTLEDGTVPETISEEVAVEPVPNQEVITPLEASENDVAPVHESIAEETTPEDVVLNEPYVTEGLDDAAAESVIDNPDQMVHIAQDGEVPSADEVPTQHEAVVEIPDEVLHESQPVENPVIEAPGDPDSIAHETVPEELSEEAVSDEQISREEQAEPHEENKPTAKQEETVVNGDETSVEPPAPHVDTEESLEEAIPEDNAHVVSESGEVLPENIVDEPLKEEVNIPDHHVTESTLQDDTLGVEDAPVEADTKELSSDEKVATEVPAPLEDVPAEEEEEEIVDNEATVGAATSDEVVEEEHSPTESNELQYVEEPPTDLLDPPTESTDLPPISEGPSEIDHPAESVSLAHDAVPVETEAVDDLEPINTAEDDLPLNPDTEPETRGVDDANPRSVGDDVAENETTVPSDVVPDVSDLHGTSPEANEVIHDQHSTLPEELAEQSENLQVDPIVDQEQPALAREELAVEEPQSEHLEEDKVEASTIDEPIIHRTADPVNEETSEPISSSVDAETVPTSQAELESAVPEAAEIVAAPSETELENTEEVVIPDIDDEAPPTKMDESIEDPIHSSLDGAILIGDSTANESEEHTTQNLAGDDTTEVAEDASETVPEETERSVIPEITEGAPVANIDESIEEDPIHSSALEEPSPADESRVDDPEQSIENPAVDDTEMDPNENISPAEVPTEPIIGESEQEHSVDEEMSPEDLGDAPVVVDDNGEIEPSVDSVPVREIVEDDSHDQPSVAESPEEMISSEQQVGEDESAPEGPVEEMPVEETPVEEHLNLDGSTKSMVNENLEEAKSVEDYPEDDQPFEIPVSQATVPEEEVVDDIPKELDVADEEPITSPPVQDDLSFGESEETPPEMVHDESIASPQEIEKDHVDEEPVGRTLVDEDLVAEEALQDIPGEPIPSRETDVEEPAVIEDNAVEDSSPVEATSEPVSTTVEEPTVAEEVLHASEEPTASTDRAVEEPIVIESNPVDHLAPVEETSEPVQTTFDEDTVADVSQDTPEEEPINSAEAIVEEPAVIEDSVHDEFAAEETPAVEETTEPAPTEPPVMDISEEQAPVEHVSVVDEATAEGVTTEALPVTEETIEAPAPAIVTEEEEEMVPTMHTSEEPFLEEPHPEDEASDEPTADEEAVAAVDDSHVEEIPSHIDRELDTVPSDPLSTEEMPEEDLGEPTTLPQEQLPIAEPLTDDVPHDIPQKAEDHDAPIEDLGIAAAVTSEVIHEQHVLGEPSHEPEVQQRSIVDDHEEATQKLDEEAEPAAPVEEISDIPPADIVEHIPIENKVESAVEEDAVPEVDAEATSEERPIPDLPAQTDVAVEHTDTLPKEEDEAIPEDLPVEEVDDSLIRTEDTEVSPVDHSLVELPVLAESMPETAVAANDSVDVVGQEEGTPEDRSLELQDPDTTVDEVAAPEEPQHSVEIDEPLQDIDAATEVPMDLEEQVEEHTALMETFEPESTTDILENVEDSTVENPELERSVEESAPALLVAGEVTDEHSIPTEHISPIETFDPSSDEGIFEGVDDSIVEDPQLERSVEESGPAFSVEREVADEDNIPTDLLVPETVEASPEINEEMDEVEVGDVVDKESHEVQHGNESILDEGTTLVPIDTPFIDLSDKVQNEEIGNETGPFEGDDNLTSDHILEGDTMLNVPEDQFGENSVSDLMDEGHAATLLDLLKSAEEDLPQDREVVDYGEQVSEPSEAIYDQETEQTNLDTSIERETELTSELHEDDFDITSSVAKDIEPLDAAPHATEGPLESIAEPSDQIDELTPALGTEDEDIAKEVPDDTEDSDIGKAAAFAIPAVIAAGAVGILVSSNDKSQDDDASISAQDSHVIIHAPPEDDTPIIQVESTKPTTIIVAGPFREQLTPSHRLTEVWTPEQFTPRSMPFPTKARLSPSQETIRPPTSYSWLGRLFQPIDPAIVDAQTTGWITLPEEEGSEDTTPQRKLSTRLRKKIFSKHENDGPEQVSLAVVSLSDRQGRQMWNYVMDAILWNWMGRVFGWFRRGKAKNN